MSIFFTADLHFGDESIIKICKRPFLDAHQMDTALICNWNHRVGPADQVYILGDLFRGSPNRLKQIMSMLNGHKHLVLGNHDELNPFEYINCGIKTVQTSLELNIWNSKIFLCHDPAWAVMVPHCDFVLVGHIHNLFKKIGNVINVGVDVWNFEPLELIDIF
jgi:calcineurin-like phosphoesterase family protein